MCTVYVCLLTENKQRMLLSDNVGGVNGYGVNGSEKEIVSVNIAFELRFTQLDILWRASERASERERERERAGGGGGGEGGGKAEAERQRQRETESERHVWGGGGGGGSVGQAD